ncbi:transcription factor bHLH18-like [Argentina anserina]|uniref:transcription factor bHLH18-like n=1 Tax=Argentina anserina TaxID=57926 RepID=UPI0021768F23|nr:transcription factor bHLH18-like [Potentilla anserina]
MDVSSAKWFSYLGLDDYNFIHEGLTEQDIATALGGNFKKSFSNESYSSYPTLATQNTTTSGGSSINETNSQTSFERPAKLVKTNGWNSGITEHFSPKPSSNSSSSHILSFENANLNSSPPSKPHQQFPNGFDTTLKPKDEVPSQICMQFENQAYGTNKKPYSMTRTPSHAQDHIMAERKRREKLSQRFIALSAIVPGLKKMDKASVLGDAIKYVKQLQESIKVLEEQTKIKTMESVVFVKKSQLVSSDDDTSSCNENFDGCSSDEPLPQIEARVSEKDVLIRIHCENQKGYVVKILSEIENFQLSVVNSSVLAFGKSTLDITIIAQMDDEFNMTVTDLAKSLRVALLKFM